MRRHPNFRFLPLILISFIIGAALFAASAFTQQSTQERPVWDVQMARNAQASSTITLQNQCKQTHTFTVTEQQTPFLQLLAAPTVNVPGNSSYDLPVRFNTNGMNAAQYQGTVIVKCETCKKEKTCKQDREVLPLRLTVLAENGPQSTPENPNQPQVPGPPISFQEKPGRLLTVNINGQGYDDDKKKKDDKYSLPLPEAWQPCKTQGCPEIKAIPSGKKIYCQQVDDCGGKECKALCHMVFATLKDGKPGPWQKTNTDFGMVPKEKDLPKDPKEKKEKIEKNAIDPDKNTVYGCGCYP